MLRFAVVCMIRLFQLPFGIVARTHLWFFHGVAFGSVMLQTVGGLEVRGSN